MHRLLCLPILFSFGCNLLWIFSIEPNPDYCGHNTQACPVGKMCDTTLEKCVDGSTALRLDSVMPSTAQKSLGTFPLEITGAGFVNGTMVTVNGLLPGDVSIPSGTEIFATDVPLTKLGPATIVITNPDGKSVTNSTLFTIE